MLQRGCNEYSQPVTVIPSIEVHCGMEGGKEHHQQDVQLSNSSASAKAHQRHGSSEPRWSDTTLMPSRAAALPPKWRQALEGLQPSTKSSES